MGFPQQINGSQILAGSIGGAQIAGGAIGGPQLSAQAVGPAALVHEVWQTAPTYGLGWAGGPAGGPVQALQYRTAELDRLELIGAFHSTSATPAATCFTLPVSPGTTQRIPCVSNAGGTVTARFLEIQAGGVCQLTPNITGSGQDVYVYAYMPLGNIP